MRFSIAMVWARDDLLDTVMGKKAPALTVASFAMSHHRAFPLRDPQPGERAGSGGSSAPSSRPCAVGSEEAEPRKSLVPGSSRRWSRSRAVRRLLVCTEIQFAFGSAALLNGLRFFGNLCGERGHPRCVLLGPHAVCVKPRGDDILQQRGRVWIDRRHIGTRERWSIAFRCWRLSREWRPSARRRDSQPFDGCSCSVYLARLRPWRFLPKRLAVFLVRKP